jgi:hypothetical protein
MAKTICSPMQPGTNKWVYLVHLLQQTSPALAHNAAQYDKLSTFYRLSEKYGKGGVKNLENGRFSPNFSQT